MPKVTFEREDLVVECKSGANLLEVADEAGVDVFRGIWPTLHCNRVKGWCNRCKVWVKSDAGQAVNGPTGWEKMPLRLGGRVSGSQRLACQVTVTGDITVHTRSGGPEVRATGDWAPTPGSTKWKERWEKRNENKGGDEEEASDEA
jgi:ferredoxin